MTSMEDEKWVYWRMKAKMLVEENEQLKQTITTIKEICNQHKIPTLLTTYIPVNCEKRKGCLDNHMVNASNTGKSNIANEILKVIDGGSE